MILAAGERTDGTVGLVIALTRADIETIMERGRVDVELDGNPPLPPICIVYGRTTEDAQQAMDAIAPTENIDEQRRRTREGQ